MNCPRICTCEKAGFSWFPSLPLIYNAPVKSTPVTVNGGDSRSLSFGNGGGPGARYGCPDTLRQMVHV